MFLWNDECGDRSRSNDAGECAEWEDRCVAVFKGTHDFSPLVTDLEFYKSGTTG